MCYKMKSEPTIIQLLLFISHPTANITAKMTHVPQSDQDAMSMTTMPIVYA
jgi:hypothetical protein